MTIGRVGSSKPALPSALPGVTLSSRVVLGAAQMTIHTSIYEDTYAVPSLC
jgi:hypothetical protein